MKISKWTWGQGYPCSIEPRILQYPNWLYFDVMYPQNSIFAHDECLSIRPLSWPWPRLNGLVSHGGSTHTHTRCTAYEFLSPYNGLGVRKRFQHPRTLHREPWVPNASSTPNKGPSLSAMIQTGTCDSTIITHLALITTLHVLVNMGVFLAIHCHRNISFATEKSQSPNSQSLLLP